MLIEKRHIVMVAVLVSGAVLAVLNQTLISPAFPSIMADLVVNATTVQWLTSGYFMVEAVVIPLSAFLIGQFSTRKLFIGGMGLFAVGSIIAAFAPNFAILLAGRMMQAAATGAVMPMTFTLILLIFPREKRGGAMGIVGLVISFAPTVGPSISGLLTDTVGWRALFLIIAALAALIIVVAAMLLTNHEGFKKTSLDIGSLVMSTLGMLALLYGLSTITSSTHLAISIASIAMGVALLSLFIRRQKKLDEPLLQINVLKSHRFCIAALIVSLLQAVLAGSSVLIPIFIQNVLGSTATISGLIMLPGALMGAICSLLAGRLFDRLGIRFISLIGGAIVFASGVGFTLLQPDSSFLAVMLCHTGLGIGLQSLTTPLITWGINSLDNSVVQHGNAVSNTIGQVGASFGPAMIVSLTAISEFIVPEASPAMQLYVGYHSAFLGMLALLIVVLLAVIFFAKDRKDDAAVTKYEEVAGIPGIDREWLVSDVMNRNPRSIPENSTISDVIALLVKTDTSGFPVVSESGEVVGFLSEGDIMKHLAREDSMFTDGTNLYRIFANEDMQGTVSRMLSLNVMSLATRHVISVRPTTPADEACKVLAARRIKKMPVIENGVLVGTLSRRNIINAMAQE